MKTKETNKTKSAASSNTPSKPEENLIAVDQQHEEEDYVIIYKDVGAGYSNLKPLGGGISSSDGGLCSEF